MKICKTCKTGETACVCVHMTGLWPFSGLAFFSFPSTMPTFTVNLVSAEWRVRVPFHPRVKRVYARSGTRRDGFAFSFLDFPRKSCSSLLPLRFLPWYLFNRNYGKWRNKRILGTTTSFHFFPSFSNYSSILYYFTWEFRNWKYRFERWLINIIVI